MINTFRYIDKASLRGILGDYQSLLSKSQVYQIKQVLKKTKYRDRNNKKGGI